MLDRQPVLEDEHVRLRPLRPDDWDALFAVAACRRGQGRGQALACGIGGAPPGLIELADAGMDLQIALMRRMAGLAHVRRRLRT